MPETSVSRTSYTDSDGNKRTQYRTTVPKDLAEAFELENKTLSWEVDTGKSLLVRIKD